MKRGDVVTGDYSKLRPAVIVQTDALPGDHASVVVCQITSDISSAADFRVTIEPTDANGLQTRSQEMADKPVTIRRERVGRVFGRFDSADIARLNVALAFIMGLADCGQKLAIVRWAQVSAFALTPNVAINPQPLIYSGVPTTCSYHESLEISIRHRNQRGKRIPICKTANAT